MKNPLRVVLWAPMGCGTNYDGAGTNAYNLYASMPKGSVEVVLVHGLQGQCRLPLFVDEVFIGSAKTGLNMQTPAFLWNAYSWLKSNAHRFDVFHGLRVFEATSWPAYWAEKLGLPAVIKPSNHLIGLNLVSPLARVLLLKHIRRKLLRKISATIAISKEIRTELEQCGIRRDCIYEIPNGVDTDRYFPASKDVKMSSRKACNVRGAFVVLFVGELVRRKRPHWIVQGVSELVRSGVDVEAVFVGPKPDQAYYDSMRDEATRCGLANRMNFTGHINDVTPYYRCADIAVLPSSNEGLPNAVLEAMASGLPVVGTPESGVGSLMGSVESDCVVANEREFAAALVSLSKCGDHRENLGALARRRAEKYFSLHSVSKTFYEMLQKIASTRRGVC